MEFVRQILMKLKTSSHEGLLMKVFSQSLMWLSKHCSGHYVTTQHAQACTLISWGCVHLRWCGSLEDYTLWSLVNGGWGISSENSHRWMPLDLTDDKSKLVQVMAWCRQATSHYLSQCWPRSMSPNGITGPQWVKLSIPEMSLKITNLELQPYLPGANELIFPQIDITLFVWFQVLLYLVCADTRPKMLSAGIWSNR